MPSSLIFTLNGTIIAAPSTRTQAASSRESTLFPTPLECTGGEAGIKKCTIAAIAETPTCNHIHWLFHQPVAKSDRSSTYGCTYGLL